MPTVHPEGCAHAARHAASAAWHAERDRSLASLPRCMTLRPAAATNLCGGVDGRPSLPTAFETPATQQHALAALRTCVAAWPACPALRASRSVWMASCAPAPSIWCCVCFLHRTWALRRPEHAVAPCPSRQSELLQHRERDRYLHCLGTYFLLTGSTRRSRVIASCSEFHRLLLGGGLARCSYGGCGPTSTSSLGKW